MSSFQIIAKFEDTLINASSHDGKTYRLHVSDVLTHDYSPTIEITAQQLDYIMRLNLDNDGTPEGYEQMYEVLEPLFKNWPNLLRPIP